MPGPINSLHQHPSLQVFMTTLQDKQYYFLFTDEINDLTRVPFLPSFFSIQNIQAIRGELQETRSHDQHLYFPRVI